MKEEFYQKVVNRKEIFRKFQKKFLDEKKAQNSDNLEFDKEKLS